MNNPTSQKFIGFVALLRALAALLVVWDHLTAHWLDQAGINWLPLELVRNYLSKPLAIKTDFGFFGVALFFLISGYIISYVSQQETRVSFITKRLFRIFPALCISIFFIIATYSLYGLFTGKPTFISGLSLSDFLWSMTLLNYFKVPQNPVNTVAWTLIIEMLFYLLCFVVLPWMKRKPVYALLSMQLVCFFIIYFARELGDNFFLFAASFAYIPYLMMGQLLYYFHSRKLDLWSFSLFSVSSYLLIIYGILTIHTQFYYPTDSYGISFMYAYLIFVICMLLDGKIKLNMPIKFISDISYSLYLNHSALGRLFITVLFPLLGYSLSLMITLLIVIILSSISFRYIEKPFMNYSRFLLTKYATNRTSRGFYGKEY